MTAQDDTELLPTGLALRLIGWLALGAVLVTALLMLLPNNDYYRWQQGDGTILFRARYVYERTHFDKRPIDVAMIGSSRMEASARVNELSAGLSQRLGHPVSVVNFGMPQEGRDLQWAVVEQLLNTRPDVKLIVLTAGAESTLSHPGFRFLGTDAAILGAPAIYNLNYIENALTVPYRHLAYFIQGLAPSAFRLSTQFDPAIYDKLTFDPTETFTTGDGILVDRERVMDPAQRGGPTPPAAVVDRKLRLFPLDQRYAVERHYLRRIAALAREKKVTIAFLRVPTYRGAEEYFDDPGFYTAIGPVLEPVQLADDYRNYMDKDHLGRTGTAKLSPWLVEKLAPIVTAAEETH